MPNYLSFIPKGSFFSLCRKDNFLEENGQRVIQDTRTKRGFTAETEESLARVIRSHSRDGESYLGWDWTPRESKRRFSPGDCDCRPFGQPQVDRAPPFFSSKFIQHKHDGSRSLDHGKSTIIYDAVGFVTKLGHMYFILLIIPGIIYK